MKAALAAHCPACDGRSARAVGRTAHLALVRCRTCGLTYSFPQPIARVEAKYRDEYDLATHFAAWEPRKRLLYARRLELIGRPAPGRDRLCDVGCGDGQFLAIAREWGWKPHGIELNPPAAARSRARGFQVFEGTVEALDDLPWHSFDLVTSWDVLEHTPHPREFVRRLGRLAAPAAPIRLTTLNLRSLAYGVFGLHWSMVCDDHFTYWTAASLARLFRAEGMQVEECYSFGVGRDFVSAFDRPAAPPSTVGTGPSPATTRWDAGAAVATAENVVNAVLKWTGGGVGLYLLATPPP